MARLSRRSVALSVVILAVVAVPFLRAEAPTSDQQVQEADLILAHGRIWTGDDAQPDGSVHVPSGALPALTIVN